MESRFAPILIIIEDFQRLKLDGIGHAITSDTAPIAAAFSKFALMIDYCILTPACRVPCTTVKVLAASLIDQQEQRVVGGVDKVTDYSLFWFPKMEPLAVCGAKQYSAMPVAEWKRIMKPKYYPKLRRNITE